jgi:2'-5' RNA ligase
MHLTLKFLSDTAEEEVPNLARRLDAAAQAGRPCTATLGGLGAFPDLRRPRVLWVGLDEPSGELVALQKRVDEATRYLVEPDPRGFESHLTLGRIRSPRRQRELSDLLQSYRLTMKAPVPVREIVLIRSVLDRAGPTYTPLHRSRIA